MSNNSLSHSLAPCLKIKKKKRKRKGRGSGGGGGGDGLSFFKELDLGSGCVDGQH